MPSWKAWRARTAGPVSKAGRVEGAVEGDYYVIRGGSLGEMKKIQLAQAREDQKLAAAIRRNGWEPINGG